MNINSDLEEPSDVKIISYNLNDADKKKQLEYEKDSKKEQIRKFYNVTEYKTQLLNIDSRYRNKIPKNIYTTDNNILINNPISVTRNSNIIKINYPNHKFNIGDSIIIQNIKPFSKVLSNCLYFFDHFSYFFINYNNHGISNDFSNYYNEYNILIQIINDIGSNTSYYNIPINLITQVYNVMLPSQVNKVEPLIPEIYRFFNVNTAEDLDPNYIALQLPFAFTSNSETYYIPSDVFKISFLNIGGIPLNYINSDYPIDYNKNQGYQEIINVDLTNIYIKTPIVASNSSSGGGSSVQIMLITNTIAGYPNSNNYTINLKKNFNNVVRIELVSTEIPFIDFLVKSSGPYINNKLYWKHLDDGNYIYQMSIPEGNYDSSSLIKIINTNLNNIPRLNSTIQNMNYNIFTVTLNTSTQEIQFIPFKNTSLPNSLTAILTDIGGITYVKLNIHHPGNLVEINDTIEITGATKIGTILDISYINKTFTIYETNTVNQTYSVLIAPLNQITNETNIDLNGNGGPSTIIKTKAKVSFLFDRTDTLGNILGFKDVSKSNAITPFSTLISNLDPYLLSTNLNSVGNIDTSKSLLNLSGSNFYILMYINDYETIINNSNQKTAFAKILLSGNPGDILFNTFVNYPLEFDFPISTISEFNIYFTYPDGTLVDFRNINHSFTLRIIEKVMHSYKTQINSKDTSYYETVINP